MRPLETIVVLALAPSVIAMFMHAHRRPRWTAILPFGAVLLCVLQEFVEGYRWQMVPVYAVLLLLCLANIRAAMGREAQAQPQAWCQVDPDLLERIQTADASAPRRDLVREFVTRSPLLTASVHLWVEDTKFVLDQLAQLNETHDRYRRRLDLRRIGILGMSFGGTVAGQACLDDERFKAGLNLDGEQLGELLDRPLQQPFMFMHSDAVGMLNAPMFENAAASAWYIRVKGAKHFDFTDFPLVAPGFRFLGMLGQLGGSRMTRITNAYVLAFFDHFLKDAPSRLLIGASNDYPEVQFDARNTR